MRIDVERAMERVNNFRILQGVMPITLSKQASNIIKNCAGLSNVLPLLVHDEEDFDFSDTRFRTITVTFNLI